MSKRLVLPENTLSDTFLLIFSLVSIATLGMCVLILVLV